MRSLRSWLAVATPCWAVPILIACRADSVCPSADLMPLETTPSYAVVLSDFSSSAIALLDGDGALLTEAWIDSGTRASAISAGLGGDAVLPHPLDPGRLTILERYNADRLTWLTYATGDAAQLDLRGDDPDAPTGHSPNIQDVLRIDSRHALVSRLNPSFHPRASDFARGNDVIVVDVEDGRITQRIDLEADLELATDDGATTRIYARPSTLVLIERGSMRRVLVGLQRLDASFMRSGPAAIAVIDPETLTRVGVLELPEFVGCHALADIPEAPERAFALCTGPSFVSEAERRQKAGVLELVLTDTGALEVERSWHAADHPEVPPPTSSPLALDAERVAFVADPRGNGRGVDRFILVDMTTEHAELIFEADDSFVLGASAFNPAQGLLLLPDAHARAVHRMQVDGANVSLHDSVPVPLCRGLPPRQITQLR